MSTDVAQYGAYCFAQMRLRATPRTNNGRRRIGWSGLKPILFPTAIAGEAMTAAMTLLATAEAVLTDVRGCLGGEPSMVQFLASYLWDHDPIHLSGLRERAEKQVRQS